MNTKTLALALTLVISLCSATFAKAADLINLPTQFGGTIFVQKKTTYAVATTDVQNLWHKSKLSLDVQTFAGMSTSGTSRAVAGTALALSYSAAPNLNFVAGLGVLQPLANFSVDKLTTSSIGEEIGFSYSFSIAPTKSASAKAVAHVLDGPGVSF